MTWNISSECISVIMLCIIWVYARKGSALPTLKNRLFQICFLVTFCAMVSNVCSTLMLYRYEQIPLVLIWIVTMVYFITTPLMGVVYYCYAVAVLYEGEDGGERLMLWSAIPAALYFIMVLLNPFTKAVFDVVPGVGYVRGPLIAGTYAIFYLYCLACVVLTLIKGRRADPSVRHILVVFPIVALVVILIQARFPDYILSGSAATCALLLLYLYLQNKQISIDHLTGIPNRQEFLKLLDLRLKRHRDEPFTVMVLSLRGFKAINNSFGQQNGDIFLQEICKYLCGKVAPDILYRYSGDEFAVLLEGEEARVTPLLTALLTRMARPWRVGGYSCVIPGAVGIVHYPTCAESREDLISSIEYAVSQAKKDRSKGYSFCTPDMVKALGRRNEVAQILKDALITGNFQLHYQPIYSIKSGRFPLAESLMRMGDTPLGPIYPDEFIPIAEDTGLIVELTYRVLGRVCVFIRRLMDEGRDFEGLSVNFSSIQFAQPDVLERVCSIIEDHGVPYSKIKIEITESVVAENYDQLIDFIREMHQRGVLFGLDDFGTGYSNVSAVFTLPLDIIKLDRSLLLLTQQNPGYAMAVRKLVGAFKEMGMRVLAEGVETEAQRAFVESCGCDLIQGFLYARPEVEERAMAKIGLAAQAGLEPAR